jgi:hypothetical protein
MRAIGSIKMADKIFNQKTFEQIEKKIRNGKEECKLQCSYCLECMKKNKVKKIMPTQFEKYRMICAFKAPYPLNYFAHSDEYKGIGILIGMLIEKEIIK